MTRTDRKTSPGAYFSLPDHARLREEGWLPVDMHVHTCHTDGFITVRDMCHIQARSGFCIAITDHNSISAVREARDEAGQEGAFLPGIEVSASDGPHILLYFERFQDLEDWFVRYVSGTIRECPYMAVAMTSEQILDSGRDSGALAIAAHPYGYSVLPRGLLKCIEAGAIPRHVSKKIDGLEVISGVLPRRLNRRAADHARHHHLVMTGGSDAHMVHEIGRVVTCAEADTPGEFLEQLRKRKNIVIGMEHWPADRLFVSSAVLSRYLPYIRPGIRIHLEQNFPSVVNLLGRARLSRKK